jgi:hypothetical protein
MFNFHSHPGKIGLTLLLTLAILVVPIGVVLAGGQPGVECDDAGGATPGNSALAPGSAFNEDGVAGTVYAGEQDQNDNNPHSVSQYDIACFKVAAH